MYEQMSSSEKQRIDEKLFGDQETTFPRWTVPGIVLNSTVSSAVLIVVFEICSAPTHSYETRVQVYR